MTEHAHIPDEAVTAGVENLRDWLLSADIGLDEFERMGPLSATDVIRGVLSAALPIVLASRPTPRLLSGDIPITERTPHGVWIADGPDPKPSLAVPCGGPSGCDDCRAYSDLRQHLVEQIIALDEQHQRETADLRDEAGKREALMEMVAHRDTKIDELSRECDNLLTRLNEAHATAERVASEQSASRDSETAELREEYAGFFHPAWPDPLYFQYGDDPRANAARWYAEHVGRQPQIEVRRRVLSDWVTVDAASLRGKQ